MNFFFITTDPATPSGKQAKTPVFDEGEAFQGSPHSNNEVSPVIRHESVLTVVDKDGEKGSPSNAASSGPLSTAARLIGEYIYNFNFFIKVRLFAIYNCTN
jgi:hypothetical protein